ncbi:MULTISPECIES: nitrous oxide reductase accessory protein NosL [Paenibacillus]|nr:MULTISPECIES: nitrous oxide reductase accessory protein NosL [Paenibacillus]
MMKWTRSSKSYRVSLTALCILAVWLMTACGSKDYKPQAINEETDRCVICNMAIKDDVFATQIITTDGQSLKFDDIGCMNEWITQNGTDTVGATFVRDYNSSQWLKYEKAYYVYDASIKTPMAYGLVSFEQKTEAEAFMKEQGAGKLMTAEQLEDHSWEVNRDMMDMGSHDHSHTEETADAEETHKEEEHHGK